MVVGHQHDQRLPVDHVVVQVVVRLGAHEGEVEAAAGERFGEIRRIVAGDRDVDVAELVMHQLHRLREPAHLEPGLEADGERLLGWLRGPAVDQDPRLDDGERQRVAALDLLFPIGQEPFSSLL
jgi:hypothetical protein